MLDPATMMMLAQAAGPMLAKSGSGGGAASPTPAPTDGGGGGGLGGVGMGLAGLGSVLGGAGAMFGGGDEKKAPPPPMNPGLIKPEANKLERELYDRMMMMALEITPKNVPRSLTFAKGGRPPTDVINLVGEIGPELFVSDAGRMNMIGESGPEFFDPASKGTVVPNKNLPASMAGGKGPQQVGGDKEIAIQPKAEGGPVGGSVGAGGDIGGGRGDSASLANYQPAPYQPSYPGSQYALANTVSQQPLFTPQQTTSALQQKGPIAGEMTSRVMAQGPTYQYDPNTVNQEFQEQVFNPAMTNFSTNLAPFMREQALMSGSATGEETPRYITRQAGQMAEGLEAQRSAMQTAGRDRETAALESQANRQLQAMPIMMDTFGDPLQPARDLAEYRNIFNATSESDRNALSQLEPQIYGAFPDTDVTGNVVQKFAQGGRIGGGGDTPQQTKRRRQLLGNPANIGLDQPAYMSQRGGAKKTMTRMAGLQQFMQAMFGSNQPLLPSQEKVSDWKMANIG